MAAILHGVTCKYGLDGSVAELVTQSYSITSDFQSTQTVEDENGLTVTVRYDNRKSVIKVDGLAMTESIPVLGAAFSFEVNTSSAYPSGSAAGTFDGYITSIQDQGTNKGWTNISITAECYEAVTA
jgi:hypothetical protein